MKTKKIKVYYSSSSSRMTDNTFDTLLFMLPVEMQKKINAYKKRQNQQECLLGKILLLHSLRMMGYEDNCLEKISYNNYGRPYLNGEVDFNISHSGKYIVCAIAQGLKVGIDIEEIKESNLSDYKIAMTNEQWIDIFESLLPNEKFFRYWTIKESVIKADGKGMSIPLDEIFINDYFAYYGANKWNWYPITIDNNYSCTLASCIPGCEVVVEELILNDFNVFCHEQ